MNESYSSGWKVLQKGLLIALEMAIWCLGTQQSTNWKSGSVFQLILPSIIILYLVKRLFGEKMGRQNNVVVRLLTYFNVVYWGRWENDSLPLNNFLSQVTFPHMLDCFNRFLPNGTLRKRVFFWAIISLLIYCWHVLKKNSRPQHFVCKTNMGMGKLIHIVVWWCQKNLSFQCK